MIDFLPKVVFWPFLAPPRLHEGVLPAVEPAVPLALPPDWQAVQVQLLLQVLHRRARPAGAHPQASRLKTREDSHLCLLRQVLHPGMESSLYVTCVKPTAIAGDLPGEAHAEARGPGGQESSHQRWTWPFHAWPLWPLLARFWSWPASKEVQLSHPGKMDPLAAMYGYHHQPLPDHRLGELDPREQVWKRQNSNDFCGGLHSLIILTAIMQGYSGAGWDPRTSSAFSPLQPPQAPVAHKTSTAHGFDLKGFEQKSAANFEQKAPGFDLKGFDQKGVQGFDPSGHFSGKASTQSSVQQDMKGGFISLARWETWEIIWMFPCQLLFPHKSIINLNEFPPQHPQLQLRQARPSWGETTIEKSSCRTEQSQMKIFGLPICLVPGTICGEPNANCVSTFCNMLS